MDIFLSGKINFDVNSFIYIFRYNNKVINYPVARLKYIRKYKKQNDDNFIAHLVKTKNTKLLNKLKIGKCELVNPALKYDLSLLRILLRDRHIDVENLSYVQIFAIIRESNYRLIKYTNIHISHLNFCLLGNFILQKYALTKRPRDINMKTRKAFVFDTLRKPVEYSFCKYVLFNNTYNVYIKNHVTLNTRKQYTKYIESFSISDE